MPCEPFLVGCGAEFNTGNVRYPEAGDVLSPWVRIEFTGKKAGSISVITVGNRSSDIDDPNECSTAVIKSFVFGASDGQTAEIEIHDQQGSSFVAFMENLLKEVACAEPGKADVIEIKCRFGWIKTFCNGPAPHSQTCEYRLWPKSVQTNFAEGKFMYTLTCTDLGKIMIEQHKEDKIIGHDGDKVHLVDAVRKVLTEGAPAVAKVSFKKFEKGKMVPLTFKDYDDDPELGPKRKWEEVEKSKLDAATEWIAKYVTGDSKAVRPVYDSCTPGGEIIFWQDTMPKPCQKYSDAEFKEMSIGTYVVNGGKNSRVIEFNPQVDWTFWQMPDGGNMGNQQHIHGGNPQGEHPGILDADCGDKPLKKKDDGVGSETSAGADEDGQERWQEKANEKTAFAQAEHMRSNPLMYKSITADLKIMGDPELQPIFSMMKFVSLIFINPFHHSFVDRSTCGDWIAKPVCNEVLSNRGWQVRSVTHRIEGGTYTTTINIFLPVPGVDLAIGNNAGGDPKGWRPKPC